jgi:hypothetical protein
MTASSSAWIGAALAVFVSVAAQADPLPPLPSEEQVNSARALYRETRELERAGKIKEALDKALEAYNTAATPVTALEAARLLVEAQRLIEARNMARGVALIPVSPRESDKGREARQQAPVLADTLDARIPKLAVGDRPGGVDVMLDGKRLPEDAMVWQGVDPGAHALELRMGNRSCTTLHVVLAEGEQRTIDLHDAAASCKPETSDASAPPGPSPASHVLSPNAPTEPIGGEARISHPWRPVAGAVAGLGVAAVGVGAYLAMSAKSDYDSVASQCTPGCTQPAFEVRTNARSRADVATVVTIAGAATIGAGALLWFGDPGHTWAQVALGPTSVRLVLPLR